MRKCDGCVHLQNDDGAIFCTVKGDCINGQFYQPAPSQTNGDKIRAMGNNSELGKALSDIWFNEWPSYFCDRKQHDCPEPWDSCVSCIISWLNKKAEKV